MASKLVLLPIPEGLKKAVILDRKSTGVQGGTFTSGAWRTRDLTTVEGDTSLVSLSNNQFTLPGGSYIIWTHSCARGVLSHQTRLYNITDSSVAAEGSSGNSPSTGFARSPFSSVHTQITIGSATTFELQHICETTAVGSGFGTASGANPTYSQITVLKL